MNRWNDLDVSPAVAEVIALHRAAEQSLRRGRFDAEYLYDGRSVPPWLVDGIERAIEAGHMQFAEAAGATGSAARAVLTPAGRARYSEVRRRYVRSGRPIGPGWDRSGSVYPRADRR